MRNTHTQDRQTHTHSPMHTHTQKRRDQGGGIKVPLKLQVTNDKSQLVLAFTWPKSLGSRKSPFCILPSELDTWDSGGFTLKPHN